MYIVVVVTDGHIDSVEGYTDQNEAKLAADAAAANFDSEYNPGDVEVFEVDKTGASKSIYTPAINDEVTEADEQDEEEDEDLDEK
jgi:hypothetical protein